MERMQSYLIAIGLIVGMMLLWSIVQAGWRKVFAAGSLRDVLSMRGGCGSCKTHGHCIKDEDERCDNPRIR
ncbi:MAG: hypothetical protein DWQ05_06255 [Calditrichaeota bacterium]|nr:MAG: hypothetical protein DWQ05_06255 [Calditrichota bacterium]